MEDLKAPEAPVADEAPAAEEVIIENRRTEVEKQVASENDTFLPDDVPPVKEEPLKEGLKDEADPLEKIKKSVQKRIDKVVAKQKSAEEKLAEAEAEIERLKSERVPKSEVVVQKNDAPPTVEQVEAYIIKMREEGNVKEEIAAQRYLIKLEKEAAIREVEERQNKTQKEADGVKAKQLEAWTNLQKDYAAYDDAGKLDESSDLNLSNQKGLLYTTALALYQDKELHKDYYNDPDTIQGFRRAVSDAYREIHQQGLIKTPKGDAIIPKSPRGALADPSAEVIEDAPNNSNSLSDAEKVREDIKNRNQNRYVRRVPSQ